MDESLWPARNVAEHVYCPRLFYLMEVEGIHLPNADTEKGMAVHRRVDRPNKSPKHIENETDPDKPEAIRSLTLTSKELGLTATLDLAEIRGNSAVPIEYRKGRPRFIDVLLEELGADDGPTVRPVEPWPTDRVQVGLQVILLEEAGYTVPEAILYYAAEKRRVPVKVDQSLRDDALATLKATKQTAAGPRPLPLLNDSRCVRCSLQPVCLPDEVNHQRTDNIRPRKIWPPRDDGFHLVAQENGTKIGVRGQCIRITNREGQRLDEFPIANIESVALLGAVQISTQALHVLSQNQVPIGYLSPVGRLIAMVEPHDSTSANIRKQQVRRFDNVLDALLLTRALVSAKISNQRTLLLRNHTSLPKVASVELDRQAKRVANSSSIDSIRGHEGQAAAIYFEHFAGMIRKPQIAAQFDENGRQRRPPPDPINACLSMGYTMLTHECISALRLSSLEPSIGAFHSTRPGRPALALDLMEPFRPLIADSVAIGAFNRGELTENDFYSSASGCLLNDKGRRSFFGAYGRRMNTEITHPAFGYRISYRRMLSLHARMVAAWLLGEIPTLEFLTTR